MKSLRISLIGVIVFFSTCVLFVSASTQSDPRVSAIISIIQQKSETEQKRITTALQTLQKSTRIRISLRILITSILSGLEPAPMTQYILPNSQQGVSKYNGTTPTHVFSFPIPGAENSPYGSAFEIHAPIEQSVPIKPTSLGAMIPKNDGYFLAFFRQGDQSITTDGYIQHSEKPRLWKKSGESYFSLQGVYYQGIRYEFVDEIVMIKKPEKYKYAEITDQLNTIVQNMIDENPKCQERKCELVYMADGKPGIRIRGVDQYGDPIGADREYATMNTASWFSALYKVQQYYFFQSAGQGGSSVYIGE